MPGKKKPMRIAQLDMHGHAVDCEEIPDAIVEDLSGVIFRQVRAFFSNPQVKADYDAWLAEYRKTHEEARGGEVC